MGLSMSSQGSTPDMELMWLYSLCQCILSMAIIVMSVRLCMAVSGGGKVGNIQKRTEGAATHASSVSRCLRLCLGWVGAVGGAAGIPVTILLNLPIAQCLYTCIPLVCCPMLVQHFTMFLFMLLTLDDHLQHQLSVRYSAVITRQRALCAVLLGWVASVLSSFAQFIGLDAWMTDGMTFGSAELGLQGNWTTSSPYVTPFQPLKKHRKVIGNYLPYGGFLSKFYVEDIRNYTYADIHSSHWGVCDPDTLLSPQFLVYVHGMAVFVLPFLCLLTIYLDLLCTNKPRKTHASQAKPLEHDCGQVRSLALSLSLLVLLCLPIHIIHALTLFAPSTNLPAWIHAIAVILFQLYGLVPQILFTPPRKQEAGEERPTFCCSISQILPTFAPSKGKMVRKALCEAVQVAPWSSAKHSLKAKVCPDV